MLKPAPSPTSHPTSQQGFTLIELLLALGLMALFALLAYRGLDSVLRLHQGANEHQQKTQALDRALTQLEADLRQATSVIIMPAIPPATGFHLRLKRPINSVNVMVDWLLEQQHWVRRTRVQTNSSNMPDIIQSADMLSPIDSLDWLKWQQNLDTWSVITPNDLQNLSGDSNNTTSPIDGNGSNSVFSTDKALGIRLGVAGNRLEKLFLIGR
jgi:prepilin-type N-terminal cleavage/methylation domain-containing protein